MLGADDVTPHTDKDIATRWNWQNLTSSRPASWEDKAMGRRDGEGHQSSMGQGTSVESGPYDHFTTQAYLKCSAYTSSLSFAKAVACTSEMGSQDVGSQGGQRPEPGGGKNNYIH